jgi:hypothetical protein
LPLQRSDYIDDQKWGEMQQQQIVTIKELRAKTAVIVMHRGFNVKGTVTDPNGKPVSSAVADGGACGGSSPAPRRQSRVPARAASRD